MPSPARSVQWTLILTDASGNALCEIDTASGIQLVFKRNGFPEATMTLSYKDAAAQWLIDCLYGSSQITAQIPRLKAYRKGPNDTSAQLRFYGYLAPFQDAATTEDATLTPVFRGPFSRLVGDGNNRGFFTLADDWYPNAGTQDAGLIAKALIDFCNGLNTPNGETSPYGYVPGQPYSVPGNWQPPAVLPGCGVITNAAWVETTVARQKEYQSANVGQEIINLSALLDGFDFEVTPSDSHGATIMGEFHIHADQGATQPGAKFEYGATSLANCKGVIRTISPPINFSTVLGGNGMGSTQVDVPSVAQYGLCPIQTSASDIIDQPTLDAKASGLVRHFPVKTLQIQPDTASSPRPWDDYWIGDSVPVYVNHGAMQENTLLRVNTIAVTIDENGNEAAEVQDPVSAERGVHKAMIKAKLAGEVTDDSG